MATSCLPDFAYDEGVDALTASNIAHALAGGRFHRNTVDPNPTHRRDLLTHGLFVGQDLWRFEHECTIDVDDAASTLTNKAHGMLDKPGARSILPPWIGIGEMLADIAKGKCPEKSINEGMQHHVTIAVSNRAVRRRDLYPSEDKPAALFEPVYIKSESYHGANLRCVGNVDLCPVMTEQAISVSLLTGEIKRLLESEIGEVLVVGEISNYKPHSSGHRYFTLKDADASIGGVMWRSRSLSFTPQDGMRVVVRGRLSVYPIQGKYQIDCVTMRPEGVGDLHRAFEELKQRLGALGYFDLARKRPLPRVIRRVGIATSATGAVIRDMLTTIERRFPALEVVFRPTIVQGGEQATADIARAIEELNRTEVDVIIVGRGGGSLEDLWCFNTQTVAEAIRSSAIPIISAVGHETDVTISDFVADVRAATPTAAAELVTPVTRQDLLQVIESLRRQMVADVQRNIADLQQLAVGFIDGRAARRVTERIMIRSQRVDELTSRLSHASLQRIARARIRVDHATALLSSLHPLAPLQRGYAVIERDGHVINASDAITVGDHIAIRRQADVIQTVVEAVQAIDSSEGTNNVSKEE